MQEKSWIHAFVQGWRRPNHGPTRLGVFHHLRVWGKVEEFPSTFKEPPEQTLSGRVQVPQREPTRPQIPQIGTKAAPAQPQTTEHSADAEFPSSILHFLLLLFLSVTKIQFHIKNKQSCVATDLSPPLNIWAALMSQDLPLFGTPGPIMAPSLTFLPSFLALCCLLGAAASIPSHFSPPGCLPGSLSQLPWPHFLRVPRLLFCHQILSILWLLLHINPKTSWKSGAQEETAVVLEL